MLLLGYVKTREPGLFWGDCQKMPEVGRGVRRVLGQNGAQHYWCKLWSKSSVLSLGLF